MDAETDGHLQDFGYVKMQGDVEMGYISINELIKNNKVELDLYFNPTKWSEIKEKFEKGGEVDSMYLSEYEQSSNEEISKDASEILDWIFSQKWSDNNEKLQIERNDKIVDFEKKHNVKVNRGNMEQGGEVDDYTKNLGLVKVKFKNPKYNYTTNVSGSITKQEARDYFVGKMFDVGSFPEENMQKVIDIDFFEKGTYENGGKLDSYPYTNKIIVSNKQRAEQIIKKYNGIIISEESNKKNYIFYLGSFSWKVLDQILQDLFDEKILVKKFEKGGSTWIQKATKQMEKKGTKGLFTERAEARGLTTIEFAKKVMANPKRYTQTIQKEAQFVKNTNPELFN